MYLNYRDHLGHKEMPELQVLPGYQDPLAKWGPQDLEVTLEGRAKSALLELLDPWYGRSSIT